MRGRVKKELRSNLAPASRAKARALRIELTNGAATTLPVKLIPNLRRAEPRDVSAVEELILSRGRYGYIAKYRWLPAEDIVLILAVRHQLEAGHAGE
jgi:hypothetical protein